MRGFFLSFESLGPGTEPPPGRCPQPAARRGSMNSRRRRDLLRKGAAPQRCCLLFFLADHAGGVFLWHQRSARPLPGPGLSTGFACLPQPALSALLEVGRCVPRPPSKPAGSWAGPQPEQSHGGRLYLVGLEILMKPELGADRVDMRCIHRPREDPLGNSEFFLRPIFKQRAKNDLVRILPGEVNKNADFRPTESTVSHLDICVFMNTPGIRRNSGV